jgi:C1A family cysteine protease
MMRAVILSLAFGISSAKFFSEKDASLKYMFKNFMEQYGKTYASSDEEVARFAIFVENLKIIDARNAKDSSAQHGITKFADMSSEEFKTIYNNYQYDPDYPRYFDEKTYSLPVGVKASQDWAGVMTTPVKNQGACGSCWAFSATEQVESDFMRVGGNETILSTQQVNSCTPYASQAGIGGCNGGFIHRGIQYARNGLETDADYPYSSGTRGATKACIADLSEAEVKTVDLSIREREVGFTNVGVNRDEATIAAYVTTTGPLTMIVDASEWSSYTGGVVSSCSKNLNHAVQVVGVNEEEGYWKVRNSWGDNWGESGYIRLEYGSNMCGCAEDCAYAHVEAV